MKLKDSVLTMINVKSIENYNKLYCGLSDGTLALVEVNINSVNHEKIKKHQLKLYL